MLQRPDAGSPVSRTGSSHRIKEYRERAKQLRSIAGDVLASECERLLLALAKSYEEMAERLETGVSNCH